MSAPAAPPPYAAGIRDPQHVFVSDYIMIALALALAVFVLLAVIRRCSRGRRSPLSREDSANGTTEMRATEILEEQDSGRSFEDDLPSPVDRRGERPW